MRFQSRVKPLDDVLEAGPFVAVLFVLLLLLLLHTSLAPAPGVRVQLPVVPAEPRSAYLGLELVVAIDQNELVYFEHQVVTEEQLRQRLSATVRRSRQPLQLVLLADENVRQGAVLRLATLARSCGIEEVIMATREPLFPSKPSVPTR